MISGILFYENGVPNIMQNGGSDAIVKQIPRQPSSILQIYSTWIFGVVSMERFRSNDCLFQLAIMGSVFGRGIPIPNRFKRPEDKSAQQGTDRKQDLDRRIKRHEVWQR
jgi:hypothetical protein